MAEWRPFGASNQEGTCIWCGNKLRYRQKVPAGEGLQAIGKRGGRSIYNTVPAEIPGDYEDGFFCGLRCAYQFGVRMAQLGRRLKPKGTSDVQSGSEPGTL
jgi:hypothetical protein